MTDAEGIPNEPAQEMPAGLQPPRPAAGVFAGGGKQVTMQMIARAAGVSQGAISSLLNDRDYGIRVSPKTRERVFKVCRELGYIPNDLRAVVRMYPELGETCLLISGRIPGGLANPFVARVGAALMANCSRKPSSMAVALYEEARAYASDDELPLPLKHGIASRLMLVGSPNASILAVAHRRSNPAILVGHPSPVPGTTSIFPDYAAAARLALGLFTRHGHTHIGIVGGPFGAPEPRISEMNRAIGGAAEEFRLRIEPQDIHHGNLDFESGVHALYSMLDHGSAPTALLCLSEATAAGVLSAAEKRGVSVPGQLSVIAMADAENSLASCVPVTAVVLSAEEMASAAVKEADRQIREGVVVDAHQIVLGVRLIERMTCGPVKV